VAGKLLGSGPLAASPRTISGPRSSPQSGGARPGSPVPAVGRTPRPAPRGRCRCPSPLRCSANSLDSVDQIAWAAHRTGARRGSGPIATRGPRGGPRRDGTRGGFQACGGSGRVPGMRRLGAVGRLGAEAGARGRMERPSGFSWPCADCIRGLGSWYHANDPPNAWLSVLLRFAGSGRAPPTSTSDVRRGRRSFGWSRLALKEHTGSAESS
jgi:hypothetical protein